MQMRMWGWWCLWAKHRLTMADDWLSLSSLCQILVGDRWIQTHWRSICYGGSYRDVVHALAEAQGGRGTSEHFELRDCESSFEVSMLLSRLIPFFFDRWDISKLLARDVAFVRFGTTRASRSIHSAFIPDHTSSQPKLTSWYFINFIQLQTILIGTDVATSTDWYWSLSLHTCLVWIAVDLEIHRNKSLNLWCPEIEVRFPDGLWRPQQYWPGYGSHHPYKAWSSHPGFHSWGH